MILVAGGYGWKGIEIAEKIKHLNLKRYDKIITNGLPGFFMACNYLNKKELSKEVVKSLKPYLNTVDKDYPLFGNIKNCFKLNSSFGDYNYEFELDIKLDFNLEIEIINLKSKKIETKRIDTLKGAFYYSTLLPGIRPPSNGWYNTSSFSRAPCYSLLKYKDEEIEIYADSLKYNKSSTIQRLYKSIQVMRSRYFYKICIDKVSSQNKVKLLS